MSLNGQWIWLEMVLKWLRRRRKKPKPIEPEVKKRTTDRLELLEGQLRLIQKERGGDQWQR